MTAFPEGMPLLGSVVINGLPLLGPTVLGNAMFEFFGFGRTRKAQKTEKQGDMVRYALTSVLRHRGMAAQSIDCELVPMARRGAPDVILTKLVILRWQEGLMRLAPLLEDELFNEIRRFDGSAVASDFIFVWKFAIDSSQFIDKVDKASAGPAVPDLKSETPALAPAALVAETITPAPSAKFDLPKSAMDQDDAKDHGFAATMIADR
jgi:hypothetical protein